MTSKLFLARVRWLARRTFRALPPGRYVLANARGEFLTECHTVGDRWWTKDRAHAERYAAYQKETAINDFETYKDATDLVPVR